MDTYWNEFENAATYEHARNFVEQHYRLTKKVTLDTLQEQIDALKDENERIRMDNEHIRTDTGEIKNRMAAGMNWIMTAMVRVRMSRDPPPTFEYQTSSNA
ncbi:unnamed protein product [Rotaria sordida]|uniref:Uncharacterized protein n=1 Tax=Rotaria sordida TaxID=392033 RepID=A0A819ZGU0_9BILA|nr:unnamed protein product [Rotaria sordida]CAF1465459.1 unnamed protein product [Rotaria sordida]CAF4176763.1 unnamed protein product [Rotaria sordida]CAF4248887.1 unnamed protein product [Rotaria sordida]